MVVRLVPPQQCGKIYLAEEVLFLKASYLYDLLFGPPCDNIETIFGENHILRTGVVVIIEESGSTWMYPDLKSLFVSGPKTSSCFCLCPPS